MLVSRDYRAVWAARMLVSRDYRAVWAARRLVSRDYRVLARPLRGSALKGVLTTSPETCTKRGVRALPRNGATGNGNPTLEEVARVAGVSRATASRVFTASPKVSPKARRAVERAAEKLRYVPNRAARTLVTGRTDSVGLVIPEPTAFLFGDPFFPRLVRGIGDVLSRRLLQLVLLMPQSPADETRLEGYLSAGHVDGVLMVSLHGNDPLPERLLERGMPVVLGGRPSANSPVNFVDVDNIGGARMAVEHLIAGRHRRIATVTG